MAHHGTDGAARCAAHRTDGRQQAVDSALDAADHAPHHRQNAADRALNRRSDLAPNGGNGSGHGVPGSGPPTLQYGRQKVRQSLQNGQANVDGIRHQTDGDANNRRYTVKHLCHYRAQRADQPGSQRHQNGVPHGQHQVHHSAQRHGQLLPQGLQMLAPQGADQRNQVR